MDAYSIFKFLHVLTALAWVGGGLTLFAHAILGARANGDAELLKTLDIMNFLGKTWFIPTSMLTLVFGVIATTIGGLWLELWVVIGLAGFASTFLTGMLLIEPTGRRIGEFLQAGQSDRAIATGKDLIRIGKFDYVVMLVVVADMVLKPTLADLWVLAVFAVAIAAGAYFFLFGGRSREAAAA